MYTEQELRKYLEDLASNKPSPGGGSAAALVGALGVSLLAMVANFTVGKEKYKDVEEEVGRILSRCLDLQEKMQQLVDKDVTAYAKVSAALRMPNHTAQQKQARKAAMQRALRVAMEVPLELCGNLQEAASLCEPLLQNGNVNLISDVGVGAEFIAAAFGAAALNVRINLAAIEDEQLVRQVRRELADEEKITLAVTRRVVEAVKEKIQ